MHNRARMITASFLTRTLGIDWRCGYRRTSVKALADGDVACNARATGNGSRARATTRVLAGS